jgi:Protein of unknown function (DUF2550)
MNLAEVVGFTALAIVVVLIISLAVRRSSLARSGGLDLSWREDLDPSGRNWILGQGRYGEGRLDLFRSFSILPIPAKRLSRNDLQLGERRAAVGTESDLLPLDSVIIRCTDAGRPIELAMSEETLTGLRSWLESVPPGQRARRTH